MHIKIYAVYGHHEAPNKWLQFCYYFIKEPSCCLQGTMCNEIIPLLNRIGKSPSFHTI